MFLNTFHRQLLQSTALVVSTVIGVHPLAADNFIVDSSSTVTNDGNVLNGDDILAITSAGTITTSGVDAVGATGSNNTITNSGSIFTTGNNAEGIRAQDFSTISNSGLISTAGGYAYGMTATNNSTITNSGIINTAGTKAVGIYGFYSSTIINSGSITTQGGIAYGIYAIDGNTITNSGSLSTSSYAARVLKARNNNIIVNTGIITSTGTNSDGIQVGDNNTITNTGPITTGGNDSAGIYISHNNTLTNSGMIVTTGSRSYGLEGGNTNIITNSGSIFTSGSNAEGIQVNDNNIISNIGTITTSGEDGDGIDVEDFNTITNSGSIHVTGVTAAGIEVGSNNTILNTGLISTTGYYARGFDGFSNNTITNSGIVTTTGDKSYGMWFFDSNTITNSGSFSTSGVNAHAFNFRDNNTITNSGKIVSAQAKSFILGNNNSLNLLAPSFLGGVIDLGTNTTLNITTGPSHSVLWDLSTGTMAGGSPTFSGTVPGFYNATTQQFATFDPTAFAASTDSLSQMTRNLSNIIGMRLRGSLVDNPKVTTVTIPAYTTASLNTFETTHKADTSIQNALYLDEDISNLDLFSSGKSWITTMGSKANYDGNKGTNDRSQTQWGIATGYDWSPSIDMKLGLMGGYTSNSLDANSRFEKTYDNQSSGLFAGFYGRKTIGSAFFDFALTTGVTDHSGDRFVNDNLAPLGVSHAKSNYQGIWGSSEIAFGKHFDMDGWVVTPTARLRYASHWLEGYRETGSNANAAVGDRHVAIGEGSLELAATKYTEKGSATVRLGYLYQTSLGDNSTNVTMIGQNISIPTFDEDRHAAYVSTDLNIIVSDTINLEIGVQFIGNQDFTGVGANVRLVSKF